MKTNQPIQSCIKPPFWRGLARLLFSINCLVLTVFTACSGDDGTDIGNAPVAVQFASSVDNVAKQRIAIDGDKWTAGDKIGIFMLNENATLASVNIVGGADNKAYKAQIGNNATSSFTPDDGTPIYYPIDGKVDFVAYYPYTTLLTNYKLSVDVSNQSDASKIDVLYSNTAKGYDKNSGTVDLQFSHALSKLSFTLTPGIGSPGLAGATIAISNVKTAADVNLATGLVENLASATTINAHTNATAIVPPQTLASSKLTVTLADNGSKFECDFSNKEFKQGKNYGYTITVDKTGITVSAGDITVWKGTDGAAITGNAEKGYQVGDYYPDPTAIYENGVLKSGTAAVGVVFWLDNQNVGDHPYDKVSEHGKIVGLYERAAEALDETWATNYGTTYNAGTGWYMPLRVDADYIYCAYNGMLYEKWGQGKPSDEGKYYTNRTWFRKKTIDAGGDPITDSWYYGSPKSDDWGNPVQGGNYAYQIHFNSGNKRFLTWWNNHSKMMAIKNF